MDKTASQIGDIVLEKLAFRAQVARMGRGLIGGAKKLLGRGGQARPPVGMGPAPAGQLARGGVGPAQLAGARPPVPQGIANAKRNLQSQMGFQQQGGLTGRSPSFFGG